MQKHFPKTQGTFTVELITGTEGPRVATSVLAGRGLAGRETLLSEPRVPKREARPPLCAAGDESGSCGPKQDEEGKLDANLRTGW